MKPDYTLWFNVKKNAETLVIVLAGYKDFLWDKVFDRLKKYIPSVYDVCILSSGRVNDTLLRIAQDNDWTYMSTDINNLCLAQNLCLEYFDKAKYVFKMDEDIFVTKDSFATMLDSYKMADRHTSYEVGFVVPQMNVNCVTYHRLLQLRGLFRQFRDTVGNIKITNGLHHNKHILENPEMAKFMWTYFDIDDPTLVSSTFYLVPCPVRFSIGMILFERSTWEAMGKFTVELDAKEEYKRIGMGTDEKDICKYAMMKARPLMIDRRVLVGHFSYGPQTAAMKEFFKEHPEKF